MYKLLDILERLFTKVKIILKTIFLKPPIFIVGCSHSGTSIILAILGAHSKIYAVPYESNIASLNPRKFRQMIRKFNRKTILAGKRRWVEKTPDNIYRIKTIFQHCPKAKVLLIIRDGRDVVCSLKKRHESLEHGVKLWVGANLAGKKFWNHPRVHVFKYEELVTEFESTVRKILSFLDEKYESEMKNFHEKEIRYYSKKTEKPSSYSKKSHKQYRNWQINQPLFDGRGKWSRLSEDELSFIYKNAGEMLVETGYITNRELEKYI